MLSGETSVGKYPVEVIKKMATILKIKRSSTNPTATPGALGQGELALVRLNKDYLM